MGASASPLRVNTSRADRDLVISIYFLVFHIKTAKDLTELVCRCISVSKPRYAQAMCSAPSVQEALFLSPTTDAVLLRQQGNVILKRSTDMEDEIANVEKKRRTSCGMTSEIAGGIINKSCAANHAAKTLGKENIKLACF
jgi:ABC-type arginine transport system ATPase subunit